MTTEAPAAPAAPEAAPVVPAAPEAPVGETAPPEAPQPEKTFTQKELDEILEKRLSKERRKREELKREAAVLRKLALERGEQQPKPQPQDAEPKRENFDSYEAFIEARAEWRADQRVDKKLTEREEKERQSKTEAERRQAAESFRKTAEKFSKEVEDFDEVMAASDAPLTDAMANAIQAAGEDGPRVAYHLAKNPAEAERIASLSVAVQAREIWALEQKLKAAPAKSPSKAPAPIAPVGGKPAADATPSDTDSIDEWLRKERARMKKK